MKSFDLNIEKILENWELHHAVRELIANAIDEQLLSNTKEVKIYNADDAWIIKDFGRGIRYTHLTQNENLEKIKHPNTIGKFGIGLKDALATFNRFGIGIEIISQFNKITIEKMHKQNFSDIYTLHALVDENTNNDFLGTEIRLVGISKEAIDMAKQNFLIFSNPNILDTTTYGQIIDDNQSNSVIYINGMKVSEESNFLYSYNITSITSQIKKALNRERINLGRSAYSESIKKILLHSSNSVVMNKIADDLKYANTGNMHDEVSWLDIQEHAVKILNTYGNVVFLTNEEAIYNPTLIEEIESRGMEIIFVSENLKSKIHYSNEITDTPIVDFEHFVSDVKSSYVFDFISENELNRSQKNVYAYTNEIIKIFGGLPKDVNEIKISRTMINDYNNNHSTINGVWDSNSNTIIIYIGALDSLGMYAGILIHELIHAKTGQFDISRDFENSLTLQIGLLCAKILGKSDNKNCGFFSRFLS